MDQKNDLTITPGAQEKILELTQQQKEPIKLRIFVVGGGCGGLRYGFVFDKTVHKQDTIYQHLIVIDWISLAYLKSATIDCRNGQLVIDNPHVRTGCPGCRGNHY